MDGHSGRVGSLSWNSYILSSGCRSGLLIHHDVRQREHIVSTISAHAQEVVNSVKIDFGDGFLFLNRKVYVPCLSWLE